MSTSLRTGRAKDERSGSWFDQLTTSGSTSSPRAVRPAHHERFDKLTTSECPINTVARPEPFDSPLILSLSKDERLAQDRPVEGRAVWLVVRPAHHERFDQLTTSECPINTLAGPEPFDSPLILSLSKDERLAQDRPVEGRAVWLAV